MVITSTEFACKNLDEVKAASLRSDVARSVKRKRNSKPNLSPKEFKALQKLRKDKDITILPADKWRTTVVLDRSDYEDKISNLLKDTKTYEPLNKDPTTTVKTKLINTLKSWKKEGKIFTVLYRQIYPTLDHPQNSMDSQKFTYPICPYAPLCLVTAALLNPVRNIWLRF